MLDSERNNTEFLVMENENKDCVGEALTKSTDTDDSRGKRAFFL